MRIVVYLQLFSNMAKQKLFVLITAALCLVAGSNSLVANAKKATGSVTKVAIVKKKEAARTRLLRLPEYKAALEDFSSKRYGPALAKFEALDGSGYCCDLVHYYMAQCYHLSNQLAQAEMHYQWILAYSSDPTLRTYAQYANQQLGRYGSHRTYAGQGNNFAKFTAGPARGAGGGGGGGMRRG